jgi:ferritin
MLKLEQDLLGHILRASGTAFHQQGELRRLTRDIGDLEQHISDQITLIRELAWEAQDTASAKEAFQKMQETLRDGYAHRDLLLKVLTPEPQPA